MNGFKIVAVFSGLAFLAGCGNSSLSNPGTVIAQSIYSNSSLFGTYAVSLIGSDNNPFFATGGISPYSAVGTIQFGGNGSISGGTLTLSPWSLSKTAPIPSLAPIASEAPALARQLSISRRQQLVAPMLQFLSVWRQPSKGLLSSLAPLAQTM